MTNSKPKMFKISYYGPIRSIVKKSEELLSAENLQEPTMMRVLEELSKTYSPKFQELVFHDESINRAVNVFVNGKCLTQRSDFEQELSYGSEIEIVFISQAAGG